MEKVTFTTPDDWHLHIRDGDYLKSTLADSARYFDRAIIMPNLQPPVRDANDVLAYHARIKNNLPSGPHFEPLMTLYLTNQTHPQTILDAKKTDLIYACKLYPAGATTHSDAGVTDITQIYGALETMQSIGMPLLIHGETTAPEVDVFDREKRFIDETLMPLRKRFPTLPIVLEHITTKDAVQFITSADGPTASTITAHHLAYHRNHLFEGGLRPHLYCLPLLKRREHQEALLKAATSGAPQFFLGTDSAPHPQSQKESSCGCAGIYSAPVAIPLLLEIFEQANVLDKLEAFTSFYGADFYKLPRNTTTITMIKKDWTVPESLTFGKEQLVPMHAGKVLHWMLQA